MKPTKGIWWVSPFFMCGFLAALNLSAVPLYGDERSIASSTSIPSRSRG